MVPGATGFRHVQAGEKTRGFSGAGFTRTPVSSSGCITTSSAEIRGMSAETGSPSRRWFCGFPPLCAWRGDQVYPLVTVFDLDLTFVGR